MHMHMHTAHGTLHTAHCTLLTAHCTLHTACTAAHLRNSHLSNRIGQSARARPSRTTAALNATLPRHQRRPKPPPLATTMGSRLATTTGYTCLPCAGSTVALSNSRPACRWVWSTLTGAVRHKQSWFASCLARVCSRRRWCTATLAIPRPNIPTSTCYCYRGHERWQAAAAAPSFS